MSETPGGGADDQTRPVDEQRDEAVPDDSPLRPGLDAQTVDPATGERSSGQ